MVSHAFHTSTTSSGDTARAGMSGTASGNDDNGDDSSDASSESESSSSSSDDSSSESESDEDRQTEATPAATLPPAPPAQGGAPPPPPGGRSPSRPPPPGPPSASSAAAGRPLPPPPPPAAALESESDSEESESASASDSDSDSDSGDDAATSSPTSPTATAVKANPQKEDASSPKSSSDDASSSDSSSSSESKSASESSTAPPSQPAAVASASASATASAVAASGKAAGSSSSDDDSSKDSDSDSDSGSGSEGEKGTATAAATVAAAAVTAGASSSGSSSDDEDNAEKADDVAVLLQRDLQIHRPSEQLQRKSSKKSSVSETRKSSKEKGKSHSLAVPAATAAVDGGKRSKSMQVGKAADADVTTTNNAAHVEVKEKKKGKGSIIKKKILHGHSDSEDDVKAAAAAGSGEDADIDAKEDKPKSKDKGTGKGKTAKNGGKDAKSESKSVKATDAKNSSSKANKIISSSTSGTGGRRNKKRPESPIELDISVFGALNAGLGPQLLQRGGGRLLLSPEAKQDLEKQKELQRQGVTAASLKAEAEKKEKLEREAEALKIAEEKGQQAALKATSETSPTTAIAIATSSATNTPTSTAAKTETAQAPVSPLESPDIRGITEEKEEGVREGEVGSEKNTKGAQPADAQIIDGTTVNSFLAKLATVTSPTSGGDDSSEDGFASKDEEAGKAPPAPAPDGGEGGEEPAAPDSAPGPSSATMADASPAPAPVQLPFCPYIPALVKYVGYADDMERCLIAVSKGVLFLRLAVGEHAEVEAGMHVNSIDHEFAQTFAHSSETYDEEKKRLMPTESNGHLAKFSFIEAGSDCRVLPDPNEADQFYFWHKWHGLMCIRVALEHKLLILDCFPASLFKTGTAGSQPQANAHRKVLEASLSEEQKDDGGRGQQIRPHQQTDSKPKKDYVNANKNLKADNLHFNHTAPTRKDELKTSNGDTWSIAQPQKQALKKSDANLNLETSTVSGLSMRPQLDSSTLRGGAGGQNLGGVRRRSVEYLLQGVAANHMDIDDTGAAHPTFAPPEDGESEAAAQNRIFQQEQLDVCNNTKGIAAGIMAQYSSRSKDYGTKSTISRRRVTLLCNWINGLQLQPMPISADTLHENLCSGLLLADLLRLLLPGSAALFSHLHIPALSRQTCMKNVEQCLGIILRNKTFVFSERIPQPHEIVNACGSGSVGHTDANAQVVAKRLFNRLATFLDELFRAYVMSDFVFFNVDVPTMISRGATTVSALNQRYKGSRGAHGGTADSNHLAMDGADRYKAGGGNWNSSLKTKDSASVGAHSKSSKAAETLTAKMNTIENARKEAVKLSNVEKTKERKRRTLEREKIALEKKTAASRRGSTWGKERRLSSIDPAAITDAVAKARRSSTAVGAGVDLDMVVSPQAPKVSAATAATATFNVPSPTPRLLDTLEWFQNVLKLYHRGFSATLGNYIIKCQEVSHDREALKMLQTTQIIASAQTDPPSLGGANGVNVTSGLPAALQSVWASLQSGVAMFCVILNFYGYGTVITPPAAAAAAAAAPATASPRSSSSGELRSDSPSAVARLSAAATAAAKIRVDPIFMYGAPRTRAEHRSNIVYLFRLLAAIGIDSILTVDDWINVPDPDFLILMLHEIYVAVGEEGKAKSVVPVKDMNFRQRSAEKGSPGALAPQKSTLVPFGGVMSTDDNADLSESFDSDYEDDSGLSSLRVILVVERGKTQADAYIQGLSFADDLGLGAGGDHESEPHYLWILEGFGGPFSEAEQQKDGAKDAIRAIVTTSAASDDADSRPATAVVRRGDNGSKASAHDIEAATHARFMEALKRNQKALGGVSNILREGYGVGGTIPGSGAGGAATGAAGGGKDSMKLTGASSYTRIKKDRSKLVEVRRRESTMASAEFAARLAKNSLGSGFAHLLALFSRIKEAEAEAARRAEEAGDTSWRNVPVHHPHHHPPAVDDDGHHHMQYHRHRHYTTGELLMRALVVSEHPSASHGDDDDDDADSEDSSVEYSVDSDGEIRVDDLGNLIEHIDAEKEAAKAQWRAARQAAREEKAAIKASSDPAFDFSQLLHLQLGISAVDGEVKCYRRINSDARMSLYCTPEEQEEEEPACYSVDDIVAMHAENPHHTGVVKALRALAAHYQENMRNVEAYTKRELEMEAAYLKLEDGAQNLKIGKAEFSDILGHLESQEQAHEEQKKKIQVRYSTLLDSLSLAYAEALRMAVEYLPPTPVDESKESQEEENSAKSPSAADSRGNRATQLMQRKTQVEKQINPNRSRRALEAKRENDFILSTSGVSEKGLFSKPQPLSCPPLPDKDGHTAWDFKPLTSKHFTEVYMEQRGVGGKPAAEKKEKISIFSNPNLALPEEDGNSYLEDDALNASQEALFPSSRILVRSPKKIRIEHRSEKAKDNTIRDVFSAANNDASNTSQRSISPFKVLSAEEKYKSETGWNRSHFHTKASHNVHRKAKEVLSTTKRTLVHTPHKYRDRPQEEEEEEGEDTFGAEDAAAVSHETNKASFIMSRIGGPEVKPARFINTATHDAESTAYATRALQAAGDAANIKAFRRFLKGLKTSRTNWFVAQGLIAAPPAPMPVVVQARSAAASSVTAKGKDRAKSIKTASAGAGAKTQSVSFSSSAATAADNAAVERISASQQRELLPPPDEMDLAQPMSLPSPRMDGGDTNDDDISPPVTLPNSNFRPKPKVRGSVMIKPTSPPAGDKRPSTSSSKSSSIVIDGLPPAGDKRPSTSSSKSSSIVIDGLVTRSGKVYTAGSPEGKDHSSFSNALPWNPEPFSPVPLGEVPDADYDPAADSDASSSSSGRSKDSDDSDNDEWKAYIVEEIPSMTDVAVEAAIKWLSMPRPVHQLDSNGNARACSIVLANDVNGHRIVGTGATAVGYRIKQLDDEDSEGAAGMEFTYDKVQTQARASEADIRPVLEIRDGEGVVPMHQAPSVKLYLQDIAHIARYDGPLPGKTAVKSAAGPSAPQRDLLGSGGLTDHTTATTRAVSPPRMTASAKLQSAAGSTASVTEIPWAVSLQLTFGKRSMLAGRGRNLVSLEFDRNSDTDASNFRLHVQTLINSLPTAIADQDASQQVASQHRAELAREREIRRKAHLKRKTEEKEERARQREIRHAEAKKERARKLEAIEKQKLTLAALKAARRAEALAALDQKHAAKRASMEAATGSTKSGRNAAPLKAALPSRASTTSSSQQQQAPAQPPAAPPIEADTHEQFSAPSDSALSATPTGITVFDPPCEFKCVYANGGILKSLPLTREESTPQHQVGLVDLHDVVLVKAIHTDVSHGKGGAFYEIVSNPRPIIPGSDFVPAPASDAAPGGWLPVVHNNSPLLAMVNQEAAKPVPAFAAAASPRASILKIKEKPITYESPWMSEANGCLHDSHPEHIADVKHAIAALVTSYDAANAAIAGKIEALLVEWEGKELALLHILHAAYSNRNEGKKGKEEEEEGEDDAAVQRKMRIAAQHAHASS